MPLESTMLCLDVSGWMSNGDYPPTRIDAQYDAATIICSSKLYDNPESSVGVLTAGGKGCEQCFMHATRIGQCLDHAIRVLSVAHTSCRGARWSYGGGGIILPPTSAPLIAE